MHNLEYLTDAESPRTARVHLLHHPDRVPEALANVQVHPSFIFRVAVEEDAAALGLHADELKRELACARNSLLDWLPWGGGMMGAPT